MHHALSQPEIVGMIVRSGPSRRRGFYFTCLRLNKLFFEETVRVLWHKCNGSPSIKDLATLEIGRRRFYAQYINVLSFGVAWWIGATLDDDSRYISHLHDLPWPRLRELTFYAPCRGTDIKPLLRTNLVKFAVRDCRELNDENLEWLRAGSSRLRSFDVRLSQKGNKIGTQELQKFLTHFKSLEKLGFLGMQWTLESFETVAQYSRLHTLACPPILQGWPKKIESGLSTLTSLTCAISAKALEELSRLALRLTYLQINIEAPSQGLVRAASKFENLEILKLITPRGGVEWEISGAELISLARNCKNLEVFSIDHTTSQYDENFPSPPGTPPEEYLHPTGVDMSDDNIAAAAQHFRNLKEMKITFGNAAGLSFASIQSLCENCRDLESLIITCDVDWELFEQTNFDISFPAMTDLRIQRATQAMPPLAPNDDVLRSIVRKLADLLPSLTNFEIYTGEPFEHDLSDAVTKALNDGTWRMGDIVL
ncbi:hypothetical protein DM02DRAFT_607809 [Periconia macrospinosa]|uniref:RNI-like protein n=1 Tax=Periconia macrospinosa TaxID=97972 RepID=A0A2V1ECW3_9PLEO|nr:hypothetical protein DM02DRAFT_607809 [Periconia macrospinosa]